MNKSFAQRLAALEALEAEREAEQEAGRNAGDLSFDDMARLSTQLALSNVTMKAGRAVRTWRTGSEVYTAELDQALVRCNAMLAREIDPPRTTEALDGWLTSVWMNALDDTGRFIVSMDYFQCGGMYIDQTGARASSRTIFIHGLHVRQALCEWFNREVFIEGRVFVPLYLEEVRECRAGFASGQWYFKDLTFEQLRADFPGPNYWVCQYLRKPSGEVWNTQAGGALTKYGHALAVWAAQRGELPTNETIVQWLDEVLATIDADEM